MTPNDTWKGLALDALALADGVLQRWGGFAELDAERWKELRRDLNAGCWERHFCVSATASGLRLEPKTGPAATLAMFMEIVEEIKNSLKERI